MNAAITWVVTEDETRMEPAIHALRAAGANVSVRPEVPVTDVNGADVVLVDAAVAARGMPPLAPAVVVFILALPTDVPVELPGDVDGAWLLAPGTEAWLPHVVAHARTRRADAHGWMRPLVHDVRGALMTVSGFSDALGSSPALPSTERSWAEHLTRAAEKLHGAVNAAADIVRVTTGRAAVKREPVPLSALLGGTHEGVLHVDADRARWLVAWARRSLGGQVDVEVQQGPNAVTLVFRRKEPAQAARLRDELEQHLASAVARLLGVVVEDRADDAGGGFITLRFPA